MKESLVKSKFQINGFLKGGKTSREASLSVLYSF